MKNNLSQIESTTNETMDEYYAKVSQQIIALMKEQKFIEAIKILDEEMEQAYIPFEIMENFIKTRSDIDQLVREQTYENKFLNASRNEMWNYIYNQNKHTLDTSLFVVYLNKWKLLDEMDKAFINQIFTDKTIPNVDKTNFFQILVGYHNDDGTSFEYHWYNDYLKKEFIINENVCNTYNNQLKILVNALEKNFMKDPSRSSIAVDLVYALHTKFIPMPINFDNNDIINTLKNITNALFNDEQIIKNSITVLLKEFLE